MLEYTSKFLILILSAMFIENIVFTKSLGTSRMLLVVNRSRHMFAFSAMVTIITTLSSILAFGVNTIIYELNFKYMIEPLVLIVCIGVLYLVVYYGTKKLFPKLFDLIKQALPYAVFNCAVVGSLLLMLYNNLTLVESIAFGIGSGLGFILATWLVNEGQKLIKCADIPKAFKGLPITLLYLGIISLAFYGIVGHFQPA